MRPKRAPPAAIECQRATSDTPTLERQHRRGDATEQRAPPRGNRVPTRHQRHPHTRKNAPAGRCRPNDESRPRQVADGAGREREPVRPAGGWSTPHGGRSGSTIGASEGAKRTDGQRQIGDTDRPPSSSATSQPPPPPHEAYELSPSRRVGVGSGPRGGGPPGFRRPRGERGAAPVPPTGKNDRSSHRARCVPRQKWAPCPNARWSFGRAADVESVRLGETCVRRDWPRRARCRT